MTYASRVLAISIGHAFIMLSRLRRTVQANALPPRPPLAMPEDGVKASAVAAANRHMSVRQINEDTIALATSINQRASDHHKAPAAPLWVEQAKGAVRSIPLTPIPAGFNPRGHGHYARRKWSAVPAPSPLPVPAAAIRHNDLKAMGREIAERQLELLGLPSSL